MDNVTISREVGWIREIVVDPLATALVADAPVGATELEVNRTTDFDEKGGTLRINGALIGYASVDADAKSIQLNGPLVEAADTDDLVEVWDVENATPAADLLAMVELLNVDGDDDPIPAKLNHALSAMLPLGPRDGRGETVWVEQYGNRWTVIDVIGKQAALDLSAADPDSLGGNKPKAPTGLVLTSSTYLDAGVTRARISAAWDPVIQDVDGDDLTEADLSGYEVQIQPGAGSGSAAWLAGATTPPETTTATMSSLLVGQQYAVRVRVARGGDTVRTWSDWSDIATITTAADGTPPNKPSTPGATSRLGVHTVTWDGKDFLGNPMPPDFAYCELHKSTVNGFTPTPGDLTTLIYRFNGAGKFNTPGTYSVTDYFKLIAVDTSGNASPPSNQATSVVAPLVDVSNFPDSAMDTLYARTGHFLQLTSDNFLTNKLQADWADIGFLTAMLVRGAQMETHAGVFRGVKINDDGIKAYDSSGSNPTPTFQVDAVTGAVTLKGSLTSGSTVTGATVQTATPGSPNRIAMTAANAIEFYGSSGAYQGQIYGQQGVQIEGPGGAFVRLGTYHSGETVIGGTGGLSVSLINGFGGSLTVGSNVDFAGSIDVGSITGDPGFSTLTGTDGASHYVTTGNSGRLNRGAAVSSARHLKTDVAELDISPETWLSLTPYQFRFKGSPDEPLQPGFMREEFQDAGLELWLGDGDDVFYTHIAVGQQVVLRELWTLVGALDRRLTDAGL